LADYNIRGRIDYRPEGYVALVVAAPVGASDRWHGESEQEVHLTHSRALAAIRRLGVGLGQRLTERGDSVIDVNIEES
jgi:hypothetical protein